MRDEVKQNLESVRSCLARIILFAENPVLLWSGGADSTLLLFLAREIKPDIAIIQFRADWRVGQRNFADSVIQQFNLKVLVYAPLDRFVLPDGQGGIVAVDDYSVRSAALPVVRDVLHDDGSCVLDSADSPRTYAFGFPFDAAIVGWRREDRHFVLGAGFEMPEEINIGGSLFCAPLINFTKREVLEMAAAAEIPLSEFYASGDEKLDTGNLLSCSRCLVEKIDREVFCPKVNKNIPVAVWDRAAASSAFQERFN